MTSSQNPSIAASALNEKLAKAGVEELLRLSPLGGLLPVEKDKSPAEVAGVIPIDSLPSGFTDSQHTARNRLLPATPTREQYMLGLVRGFNVKLSAEDIAPALTDAEINYVSDMGKKRQALSTYLRSFNTAQSYGTSDTFFSQQLVWISKHLWWAKGSYAARAVILFSILHAATAISNLLSTLL